MVFDTISVHIFNENKKQIFQRINTYAIQAILILLFPFA